MAIAIACPVASAVLETGKPTQYVAAYKGYTLRETAGAAAVVKIREKGASGVILDDIALIANASSRFWLTGGGLKADGGIYVEVTSGAIEGSIYVD